MFTGIIEHVGAVSAVAPFGRGKILTIGAGSLADGMKPGDSIAVNGACLTVTGLSGETIEAEATAETLSKTNLGKLAPGSQVNLERPLAADARLHGHLVQGHVDTTTRIIALQKEPESVLVSFTLPVELKKFIVPRGSVAVDGLSLTVAHLEKEIFSCALISFTLEHTTFGRIKVGAEVNIETDIIGKYVVASLERGELSGEGLSAEMLRNWGY